MRDKEPSLLTISGPMWSSFTVLPPVDMSIRVVGMSAFEGSGKDRGDLVAFEESSLLDSEDAAGGFALVDILQLNGVVRVAGGAHKYGRCERCM